MASNHRNLVDEYSANDILLSSYDPMTLGNTFATDFALHAFVKYLRGIKIFITGKKNIQDIRPMLQAKHFSNMLDRMTNTAASYNEYTWSIYFEFIQKLSLDIHIPSYWTTLVLDEWHIFDWKGPLLAFLAVNGKGEYEIVLVTTRR